MPAKGSLRRAPRQETALTALTRRSVVLPGEWVGSRFRETLSGLRYPCLTCCRPGRAGLSPDRDRPGVYDLADRRYGVCGAGIPSLGEAMSPTAGDRLPIGKQ
jgi:hypothetical protein